jgi:hypothetical protein
MAEVLIDATVFLGMHCADERVRLSCKALMVARLDSGVLMSLEEVGRCDAVVWTRPRAMQDAYYPFMDTLHTDMKVDRVGYGEDDLRAALRPVAGLPVGARLQLALAAGRGATLWTVDRRYAGQADVPLGALPEPVGTAFPEPLERLYTESLALRVPAEELWVR